MENAQDIRGSRGCLPAFSPYPASKRFALQNIPESNRNRAAPEGGTAKRDPHDFALASEGDARARLATMLADQVVTRLLAASWQLPG